VPRKIVDLSARSEIIREEPWSLHFWESTPQEALAFLTNPREQLEKMGIRLPDECRVETVIENHDWLSASSGGLAKDDGVVVCNVGGGNTAVTLYRVTMYPHDESEVGRHPKELLHDPSEQSRNGD
jgi:hypothetical protein